jgi:hypothetical protein
MFDIIYRGKGEREKGRKGERGETSVKYED